LEEVVRFWETRILFNTGKIPRLAPEGILGADFKLNGEHYNGFIINLIEGTRFSNVCKPYDHRIIPLICVFGMRRWITIMVEIL
jgi:hypothetical protein